MEKIINTILLSINKNKNDVAKAKHGKSPEITYYDFIYAIIKFNSAKETKDFLGISEQTFNRTVKKCFPGISLKGGGQTWSYYLLYSVGYKKCFKCLEIKSLTSFIAASRCTECTSLYNTSESARLSNRIHQRNYYKKNKSYFRQKKAKYRASKLKAIPKWADLEAIAKFYDNCPIGHHVDHIIPLQGKYICGLHIVENLQYLLISENCSKSNYHESEEYWK